MVTLQDLLEIAEVADLSAAVARAGSPKAWVAEQLFDARMAGVPTDTWDVAAILRDVEALLKEQCTHVWQETMANGDVFDVCACCHMRRYLDNGTFRYETAK